MSDIAVDCQSLTRSYGKRNAVDGLTLQVRGGEIFSLLGPNGSGKTTFFRVLSTLLPPTGGTCSIFGHDLVTSRNAVRRSIGVVFQSPSLDLQLTPIENLRHHGHLYGFRGSSLDDRIEQMLEEVSLLDRGEERVSTFSGGMRRRVELAKGMLTRPQLLILDEPSTGLDPAARIDLWAYLKRLRIEQGVTIILTTHLMDEADRCDRLAVMDQGKLLACDSPSNLKERIGGDVITLTTSDPQAVLDKLALPPDGYRRMENKIRLERARGHEYVPQLIESLPGLIDAVTVGRPTLEDVFIDLTGQAFDRAGSE